MRPKQHFDDALRVRALKEAHEWGLIVAAWRPKSPNHLEMTCFGSAECGASDLLLSANCSFWHPRGGIRPMVFIEAEIFI